MDALFIFLGASPVAFVGTSAVLGLVVGSFLNVVIHRLPKMLERQWRRECAELQGNPTQDDAPRYNLIAPRSACPSCSQPIRALHNIPLVSYLALKGKCASCGVPIGARYPLIEASSGVLTAYAAWHFGFSWAALAAMFYVWAMIALAFIDLDTFFLPDNITLPLVWVGLLAHTMHVFPQMDLASGVVGAIAGYLVLWTVFWLFKLTTGKEGMGYGDFKLLAAIGAWLGWKALPLVILLSSLVGAIVGISLIVLRRQSRDVPIPFGPYLVAAGLIALFWGSAINARYLDFF